jgi:DNA-binding transcriptional LysR family regulator
MGLSRRELGFVSKHRVHDDCEAASHEADRAAGALQATPRGRPRVHCYPVLARFIAPIVTAHLRHYPEVSVDLRRGDQIIDLLEGGFDLAIRPYVPPDSSLMVRRLPIARQPRERDAAFKDDARGSPCPPYRTASTTRSIAPTPCCASRRIGGGSSVRAARHQRAAAWPSNPRKVPISGWPRRHPPWRRKKGC